MGRIEDVIVKTMISVEFSVGTACRMFVPSKNCCFGKYPQAFIFPLRNLIVNLLVTLI